MEDQRNHFKSVSPKGILGLTAPGRQPQTPQPPDEEDPRCVKCLSFASGLSRVVGTWVVTWGPRVV